MTKGWRNPICGNIDCQQWSTCGDLTMVRLVKSVQWCRRAKSSTANPVNGPASRLSSTWRLDAGREFEAAGREPVARVAEQSPGDAVAEAAGSPGYTHGTSYRTQAKQRGRLSLHYTTTDNLAFSQGTGAGARGGGGCRLRTYLNPSTSAFGAPLSWLSVCSASVFRDWYWELVHPRDRADPGVES
jgi:hypothetical protein